MQFFYELIHELNISLTIINYNIELIEDKLWNIESINSTKHELELIQRYLNINYELLVNKIYKTTRINFSKFLEKLITNHPYKLRFEVNIEKKIYLEFEKNKLNFIVTEIIKNSLIHSKKWTKIFINLFSKNNKIIFDIQNCTNWITLEDKNHIFKKFFKWTLTKKKWVRSCWLGLYCITEILKNSIWKLKFQFVWEKQIKFSLLFISKHQIK